MKNLILIYALILLIPMAAFAQGAQDKGFDFQGRLNDGANAANGRYDLQFRLYDAIAGGNQIGPLVSRPNTTLINGVFSTSLDFGATAFDNWINIFIEIGIRPSASPNAYTILVPRQQLTVVPFAVRAGSAGNADLATNALNALNADVAQFADNALSADNATNATTATNSLNLGGVPASGFAKLNVLNTGDLRTTGSLAITGDASQSITSNGFVKAMIELGGSTTRCYNGITNSSTGDCGFVISYPSGAGSGIYRINFGFPISGRFVSVTGRYVGSTGGNNNTGANYRLFDATSMEVFTFAADSTDTVSRPFTLVMF